MKAVVVALHKRFSEEKQAVGLVLKRLSRLLKLKDRAVEVYLTDDRRFPKDVLSYPAPRNFPRPDIFPKKNLGEIYLNPDYIERHNQDIILMLIHGLLHLLGYDHKRKNDRIKMENKERALLAAVRIK